MLGLSLLRRAVDLLECETGIKNLRMAGPMIVGKPGNCARDLGQILLRVVANSAFVGTIPHGMRPKAHHVLLRAGKDKTQLIA